MYGQKAHSGPSMITMNRRALMAKYFLLIMDLHSGEPFGQQNKNVSVVSWWTGQARMWQWGFDTRGGPCVRHWVPEILQDEAYWPPCVGREEAFLPTDHISLSPTAASYTPLPQLCLIFPTVLGESAPTYANVRISFINIYAGKHICSSVCTAGSLLLR